LARQAHKIKSGARLLNDQALVALCENLEAACRQGADREALRLQVTALEHGIQQLELTLQQHLLALG
jgi:two-component system sensor histidine kinase EvgS